MRPPQASSAWLSDDMAHALAAMCPPLASRDVVQAANDLAARSDPAVIIRRLLTRGADLLQVQRVVEALRALRDIHGCGPAGRL
jgi:hypothetical protein